MGKRLTVGNTVFALLVVLGIMVDPTTEGIGDSERALRYTEPWEDEREECYKIQLNSKKITAVTG